MSEHHTPDWVREHLTMMHRDSVLRENSSLPTAGRLERQIQDSLHPILNTPDMHRAEVTNRLLALRDVLQEEFHSAHDGRTSRRPEKPMRLGAPSQQKDIRLVIAALGNLSTSLSMK